MITYLKNSLDKKKIIKLICVATLMLGSAVQAMDINLGAQLRNAAENGNYELVKALLGQGVPVDAKAHFSGETPLMLAALNGHKKMCELLLAHNAQVDARDVNFETPLMYAASRGHKEICELLIAHNAQIDAKNKFGQSPMIFAANEGHKNICKLLIDAKLRPTKEERNAIIGALWKSLKKQGVSKDMRRLIAQDTSRALYNSVKPENKPRAINDIAKIRNKNLENELMQYVERRFEQAKMLQSLSKVKTYEDIDELLGKFERSDEENQ